MTNDSKNQDSSRHDEVLGGWDKDAFWYPTLDRRGSLLCLFIILILLHFDSLFGLHSSTDLLFGWIPITFGYHILLSAVHVGFLVLIYLHWPDPSQHDIDPEMLTSESADTTTTGADGD